MCHDMVYQGKVNFVRSDVGESVTVLRDCTGATETLSSREVSPFDPRPDRWDVWDTDPGDYHVPRFSSPHP